MHTHFERVLLLANLVLEPLPVGLELLFQRLLRPGQERMVWGKAPGERRVFERVGHRKEWHSVRGALTTSKYGFAHFHLRQENRLIALSACPRSQEEPRLRIPSGRECASVA